MTASPANTSISELRSMARRDAEDGGDGAWISACGLSPRVQAVLRHEQKDAIAEINRHEEEWARELRARKAVG